MQLQFAVRRTNRELQVQQMKRSLIVLSVGIIIGLIAASLYWRGTQQRSKFLFDQKIKCQQIAKQHEAEHAVVVLKVAYSPSRDSCIAEFARPPQNGGVDLTVEDLLSGEQLFSGRCTVAEFLNKNDEKFTAISKDQDAKFAHFAQ
jgi:hypothetical protein